MYKLDKSYVAKYLAAASGSVISYNSRSTSAKVSAAESRKKQRQKSIPLIRRHYMVLLISNVISRLAKYGKMVHLCVPLILIITKLQLIRKSTDAGATQKTKKRQPVTLSSDEEFMDTTQPSRSKNTR